jgi:hypothetical protein
MSSVFTKSRPFPKQVIKAPIFEAEVYTPPPGMQVAVLCPVTGNWSIEDGLNKPIGKRLYWMPLPMLQDFTREYPEVEE